MSKRKADDGSLDGALAALLALLEPAPFSTETCLGALRRANGDVAAAAELLLVGGESSASSSQPQPKRARSQGLKQWFKAPASRPQSPPPRSTPSPSKAPSPVDRDASAAGWAALLARPQEKKPTAARGTILLSSPAAVSAAGLPLALLPSPLSPSFAAQLFHEMMAESPQWGRNKLFIAGREVESNHQATGYARAGEHWDRESTYFYNGQRTEAKPYPPCLDRAASMVEEAVNAYLDSVPRYPLEYRGRWRANACAANRYDGAQAT
jgi:hypothetical protein